MRFASALVAVLLVLSGCARVPPGVTPAGVEAQTILIEGHVFAYCATAPVERWTPEVRRVIVAVHGLDRNACGMRRAVISALGSEPDDTIVVAPHFATQRDVTPGGHAFDPLGWPGGSPSQAGISSYALLDALVERFGNRHVTLVGFSGGGQFTNRYAAVSPTTLQRYVVINPSSYLWFTPERPTPEDDCATANLWRYGLGGRVGYAGAGDDDTIRARYASRSVHYLIGTADDDPNSPSLDRSCGAMAQGANREERALAYHQHRLAVFGPAIEASQPLSLVPNVGHEAAPMLASPPGRTALLGDDG